MRLAKGRTAFLALTLALSASAASATLTNFHGEPLQGSSVVNASSPVDSPRFALRLERTLDACRFELCPPQPHVRALELLLETQPLPSQKLRLEIASDEWKTGLYYAGARFYQPEIGRFLNEDPFGGEAMTPPSLHRYLYAFSNPTTYWDPTGRQAEYSAAEEEEPRILAEGEAPPPGWTVERDPNGITIARPPSAEPGIWARTTQWLGELKNKYFGSAEEKVSSASERIDRRTTDAAQRVSEPEEEIAAYQRYQESRHDIALVVEDAGGAGIETLKGAAEAADDALLVAGAPGLVRGGVKAGFRTGVRALEEDGSERLARRRALQDLMGEGPESAAMSEVGAVRAGASRLPRHHVLPQENRAWFEERGFTGDLDIDSFTIELSQGVHQGIHGGGNWVLGRKEWPGEWNQQIMGTLQETERALGRKLQPGEILEIATKQVHDYKLPTTFVPFHEP